MVTTHDIADKIGRARMAAALNVGATAISKQVVGGQFPASWYFVIQSLCDADGLECPGSLFGMRALSCEADQLDSLPTNKPWDASDELQGASK